MNNLKRSPEIANEHDRAAKVTAEKVTVHEMINFDKQPKAPVKVSIVVPVCNVEQYLEECLTSIVNQTLRDIEIICVNDGSTDGSMDILRAYAQRDARVKVISKENAGYGHTMNIGMDYATGKYIGIVESDDYVLPEMYEDLYKKAARYKADIIKSDFYRFYGDGEELRKQYHKIGREDFNYNKVIDPSDDVNAFRFIMNTWSGIYRTDFIRDHNIRHNETPGASYQDNGFWFRTMCRTHRLVIIDRAYYMNRRDNPNSSVHSRQKVYCGNEEYRDIREFLERDPALKEKFLHIFGLKKFDTYMFTINRIGDEFKREYLSEFAREFKEMLQNGELLPSYFTVTQWDTLNWIVRDPDEYYYEVVRKAVKVSVILPVYNVAPYLAQCLDSLLAQTLGAIEILCINDGSTDDSALILERYKNMDARIRVYEQENKGAGAARNFGLSIAKGQFLSFLDADDFCAPTMLEEMYRKMVLDNSDICICDSKQYDNITGKTSPCTFSVRSNQLPARTPFAFADIREGAFNAVMGWAWDKLFRRSFVLNSGLQFQEQRTTNDLYFVYAALVKAIRISIVKTPLYFQRRNVESSLSNTRHLSWDCFYNALLELKSELTTMGCYERYENSFVNYALHSCLWNLNTLDTQSAIQLFARLRAEWFDRLGIDELPADAFLNANEYAQYLEIRSVQENDNPEHVYLAYQIERLKRELDDEKRRRDSRLIQVTEKEALTVSQLVEKLQWNREQKRLLETKLQGKTHNNDEVERLNRLIRDLQNQLDTLRAGGEAALIRSSLSFKIGRLITWVPRKLRGY